MTKKKVSLQRTGAFALAMTTALSPFPSPQQTPHNPRPTPTRSMRPIRTPSPRSSPTTRQPSIGSGRTAASTGASTPTSAEQTVHYIRDGLIEDGVPVTSASSEVRKTPNRSDIPLSESIRNATNQGKSNIVWYGLKR